MSIFLYRGLKNGGWRPITEHMECETSREIRRRLDEAGLTTVPVHPSWFGAPHDRIDLIVTKAIRTYHHRLGSRSPHRVELKKRSFGKDFKKTLLEAQNHRCCYCGIHVQVLDANMPDFATFEHVHSLNDGGRTACRNLVIACQSCNGYRAELGLNAYEFAEYALNNSEEIKTRVSRIRKGISNKIRQNPTLADRRIINNFYAS